MLKRNGIDTAEADAKYFEKTLPELAETRITGARREELLAKIRDASKQAADAYRGLRDFIAATFYDDVGNGKVKAAYAADHSRLAKPSTTGA